MIDSVAFAMETNTLLATRVHRVLEERSDQLKINLLAYHGGQPYIEARLSRFPAESDVDFSGDTTLQPPAIGRKDRAFVINYMRRIATKVNQYVFKTPVQREGIKPVYLSDITATGMSLNQFMAEVSAQLTVCRWCWIGVDRPRVDGPQSVAAREAAGDRVYWRIYSASEVVDWCIAPNGSISWLLTEESEYDNTNPRVQAKSTRVRYLWEPGKVTKLVIDKDDREKVVSTDEHAFGLNVVPFVCAGLISYEPWWADEVERMQRAIMDLLSSRDTQIFRAVFALLVVSASFLQEAQASNLGTAQARRKLGTGNPIVESAEDNGITRYLGPPAEVFQIIGDAIKQVETQLYDIVGLNMSVPESRQVASAEAKAWDHLDPETVLAERAQVLEETEAKLVALSSKLGGASFTPWQPKYGKTFDITDFASDIAGLSSAASLITAPEGEKMIQRAIVKAIAKQYQVDEQELQGVLDDIETHAGMQPVPSVLQPGQVE